MPRTRTLLKVIASALLILTAAVTWAGVLSADLSITKTDGAASSIAGDSIIYTIVASNAGPNDVTGATVTDTFPAELTGCTWTCTASAGSSCTAAGAGNIADSADLLNGGNATYVATCTIDPAAMVSVANTATISSALLDPNMADNSATDTNTLGASADLSVTKTASSASVEAGAQFSYTIEVSNAGPSTATNVVATDNLPAGMTLVSSSGCAEDPLGAPTCSLGDIMAGSSAIYTLTVTAPNTLGMLANSVSVSASTADPNGINDVVTEPVDITVDGIPTLGEWGLVLMTLLLIGFGLRRLS